MSHIKVVIKKANILKRTLTGRPQPWRWIASSADNNRVLARSTERYTNRQDCADAVRLVFGVETNAWLYGMGTAPEILR